MNFKNVTQLLDHFKDEATCRAYLEQKRWQGTPACHHCGSLRVYRTNRGFKCAEKLCGKKFTVTTGTVYENTKLPLRIWFAAIYLCTSSRKGISSLQASRQLGITQKSAWFLNHRIREMLNEKAPTMLSNEVQVDETYVGGKEGNKHASKKAKNKNIRKDDKVPVVGFVEKDGNIIVKVVPWVTKKNLQKVITEHIAPDAIMVTDAYHLYNFIDKDGRNKHEIVNHLKGEYKNANGYHTNTIEGFFSILKRGIYGIYHFVSPQHLQRYCNEFASRYNTRKIADDERFNKALDNIAGRLKYADLIKTEYHLDNNQIVDTDDY
jgi:transposase-like protein